jgi:hypothetical protein
MRRLSRAILIGVTISGTAVPAASAQESVLDSLDAGPAITGWLNRVRGGAGEATWGEAADRFQYRVNDRVWAHWVDRASSELRELRPRHVLQAAAGRDSLPLEAVDWVRVVFASERAAGGKILEQVVAIRDADSVWRVADYAAWPDPEAIVKNAALDPVPYGFGYLSRFFIRDWRAHHPRPMGGRPPEPDRARAAPKRPPE